LLFVKGGVGEKTAQGAMAGFSFCTFPPPPLPVSLVQQEFRAIIFSRGFLSCFA